LSLKTNKKCIIFKDIFTGLSRNLTFNFQDFPRPKCFSRTFQVLEFSRKKPGLSRRPGNLVMSNKYHLTVKGFRCGSQFMEEHTYTKI